MPAGLNKATNYYNKIEAWRDWREIAKQAESLGLGEHAGSQEVLPGLALVGAGRERDLGLVQGVHAAVLLQRPDLQVADGRYDGLLHFGGHRAAPIGLELVDDELDVLQQSLLGHLTGLDAGEPLQLRVDGAGVVAQGVRGFLELRLHLGLHVAPGPNLGNLGRDSRVRRSEHSHDILLTP